MAIAIDGAAVKAMMERVAQQIVANVDVLSEADRATGDGDHGVGMRRGFEAALDALGALETPTPELVMKTAGTAIMSKSGGASGALFGTLFRAGAKALARREMLDGSGFAAFMAEASLAVQQRGGAQPGQKTMVDALAPSAQAAQGIAGLDEAVAAAAAAARQGMDATRDMLATTGKARSLGERSLGHVDPGALSVTLIIEAMRDFASAT